MTSSHLWEAGQALRTCPVSRVDAPDPTEAGKQLELIFSQHIQCEQNLVSSAEGLTYNM